VTMNRGYFEMVSHGGREDVPNFLSRDEQRTVMTLWTIARCPLMFGGHLPDSDAWTVGLITNAEALTVNQRSRANRQLFHANGLAAWAAETADGEAGYLAVFNTSDRPAGGLETGLPVPVRLADAGFTGETVVTDVWTGKKVGTFRGEFAPVVPHHGAGLYRLEPARTR
jgi:alpha-galactosidase